MIPRVGLVAIERGRQQPSAGPRTSRCGGDGRTRASGEALTLDVVRSGRLASMTSALPGHLETRPGSRPSMAIRSSRRIAARGASCPRRPTARCWPSTRRCARTVQDRRAAAGSRLHARGPGLTRCAALVLQAAEAYERRRPDEATVVAGLHIGTSTTKPRRPGLAGGGLTAPGADGPPAGPKGSAASLDAASALLRRRRGPPASGPPGGAAPRRLVTYEYRHGRAAGGTAGSDRAGRRLDHGRRLGSVGPPSRCRRPRRPPWAWPVTVVAPVCRLRQAAAALRPLAQDGRVGVVLLERDEAVLLPNRLGTPGPAGRGRGVRRRAGRRGPGGRGASVPRGAWSSGLIRSSWPARSG